MPKHTQTKSKPKSKRPTLTANEARTFEGGESLEAYMQVATLLAERNEEDDSGKYEECECEPYSDVFTYNRWAAQGMQVKRGEKSLAHVAWIPTRSNDIDAPPTKEGEEPRKYLRPKTVYLFCRHQVSKAQE